MYHDERGENGNGEEGRRGPVGDGRMVYLKVSADKSVVIMLGRITM